MVKLKDLLECIPHEQDIMCQDNVLARTLFYGSADEASLNIPNCILERSVLELYSVRLDENDDYIAIFVQVD